MVSMYGTLKFRPGLAVRTYFPKRSTIARLCCCTVKKLPRKSDRTKYRDNDQEIPCR